MDNGDFSSPTNIRMSGHVGVVEYGNDRNMIVMFFNKSQHSPVKSTAAGRPVYEDVVFVRIHPPGERLNIIERPANDDDRRRFALQWNQFVQNQQQLPEGTPVDLLYPQHPSVASLLRAHGVHVIEQLANLSAHAIENIGMGAQRYVNDAQRYIESSTKGVDNAKYQRDIEDRDSKIRVLSEQLKGLQDTVDRLTANNSNGMGMAQAPAVGGTITPEQLSQLVAQQVAQAMGRPIHPVNAPFDPQTAQIAATHPTKVIAQDKAKPKRSRAKLA